ncbi:pyruvate kinase [Halorubellus sp. JP-L1]|uniref:pyruvate kinase n=1 Tax=Halorubellus sp. JP-L1 TaxID=2715753 RepID=UPI00140AB571|nr:pyruvate kinase [Halorubellus sp. JP-L1]NHN42418.1 pyruvate kinase [Halorubellus sp. JP-L1]
MRRAKIVCTLGPASSDRRTIRDLADAGMSVARVNSSHGTLESRASIVETVRSVDEETEFPLATMVDMQGPEVRTAPLDEPIHVETGSTVTFVAGDTATPEVVGLSCDIAGVGPGDKVLLDDGRIETTVERVDDDGVHARVDDGGELASRKGVNTPGVDLDLEVVTESDRRDLELAAEHDVDFVAASFVRDAADVFEVSEVLEDLGADVPVVAKIERAGAVENLEEIIDAAYGVMVARGDLGVELPMEQVPMIQKRIIRRCQQTGTPVITATEMLDSMVHERRPTRAEASDVANAVLDGTDAVMLSGETAIGDHPVEVVKAMDRIVSQVEGDQEYDEANERRVPGADDSRTDALARSARYLARDLGASAIVAGTESGYTALKTAKYRPNVPIVAATNADRVRRQLALSWGVNAQYAPLGVSGADDVIEHAVQAALDADVAESGDTVVVLSGMMTDLEGAGTTNMLKVHIAAETLAAGRGVVSGYVSGPLHHVPDGDITDLPAGAIVALDADFDDEFHGDVSRIGGIVDARSGMTGYPALVAREVGIPMVSGADVVGGRAGEVVTLDAERGVVYEGEIRRPGTERAEY